MVSPYEKEAWCYHAVGLSICFLRIYARSKVVGWNPRHWQGDDFLILLVPILFSGALTCLHFIGIHGTNSGLTDDKTANLSEEKIKSIAFGSEADFFGWQFYVSELWCLKACMIFMYFRLMAHLKGLQQILKAVSVMVGITYIVMMGVIIFHCVPPKQWQVQPYPGDRCTLGIPNLVTLGVTNISTDFILLLLPIPLLVKVQLPLRKKIGIALLLCSGVFIIIATILRVSFTLRSIRVKNNSAIWAIRENFVAIIVVNAPLIKPLFSRSSSKDSPANTVSGGTSNTYQLRPTMSKTSYPPPSPRSSDEFEDIEAKASDMGSETSILPHQLNPSSQQLQIKTTTTCDVSSETKGSPMSPKQMTLPQRAHLENTAATQDFLPGRKNSTKNVGNVVRIEGPKRGSRSDY